MFFYQQQQQQQQHPKQQEASIINAPSMAQSTADFPAIPMFGVNSSPADLNLYDNFAPLNDLGRFSGEGGHKYEFSRTRKRRREEEMVVPINSNFLTGHPQQLSADDMLSNAVFPPLPFNRSLFLSDDPNTDLSMRMQKELLELDRFISTQMESMRVEMERKRRRHWANAVRAVEDGVQRILRAKDAEITSVTRRNSALEERVNTLALEGQMWKTLARTNEAAATALRRDIELAQEAGIGGAPLDGGDGGEAEDSVSYCEGRRGREEEDDGRFCRGCRKREISILVLPCRHLCLCSECDPATDTCPLCGCQKSASIKVHMS